MTVTNSVGLPQVESLPGEYKFTIKPQTTIYNNTLFFLYIQSSYAVDSGSITFSFNNKEGLLHCEPPQCLGFVPSDLEGGKESEVSFFGVTYPKKGFPPKFIFTMFMNLDQIEKISIAQFFFQG